MDNLIIGSPIAKGCSAVVYAAALKDTHTNIVRRDSVNIDGDGSDTSNASLTNEELSPQRNANRYVHNFGSSLENPHFLNSPTKALEPQKRNKNENVQRRVQFVSNPRINHFSNSSELESNAGCTLDQGAGPFVETSTSENSAESLETHPLALKMMFNYDIQSNAMSILRAMYKETIPAINKYSNADADGWEKSLMEQTIQLPAHPNIVLMVGVFCAQIPNLMQSTSLYPMALPQRLNPNGYGRNMSLFLLMKRYEQSLEEYLQLPDISMRTRLLLFTQLLEGVAHLYRHGVAHRDLKSDNILIDLNGGDLHPILVLSDFGCCIADKNNGLTLPYTSYDIDKGGNAALMAPEIITKTPGTFSVLDYSKSDLWSCGAIAYEIFGSANPFYFNPKLTDSDSDQQNRPIAKSISYSEADLPQLNENVPVLVRKLVENILRRNPNKRLAPDIAANVMQLFLWAPSSWLNSASAVNNPEILQWLLSLTTKVLYEVRVGGLREGKRDPSDRFGLKYIQSNRIQTEYSLLSSFLIRAQLQPIRNALEWIHQATEMN